MIGYLIPILVAFKRYFLYVFDSVVIRLVKRGDTKRSVLIVRLDAIGDFLLWIDSAKAIRELYPGYQIVLLGNVLWTELARGLLFWDDVWSFDRKSFIGSLVYRFKMLKKIHSEGFEVAIQPTFSREFELGDAIIRASDALERIGSEGDLSNIKPRLKVLSDRFYTKLIPVRKTGMMELERNAEFMRNLGVADFKSDVPQLRINVEMKDQIDVDYYYVLFPGASMELKKWSLAKFEELAKRIYQTTGWKGIICGGPGEESLGEILAKNANVPLQNEVGKTSLSELVKIISRARILISNDTSAVHIAAAVTVPAVCILGGGHYGRFLPYEVERDTDKPLPVPVFNKMKCFGCNWRCIYNLSHGEPAPCIESVSVERVWEEVLYILNDNRYKSEVNQEK